MEKEQVEMELKELIGEVMPEIEDVDFSKDIEQEYGVNSISIIKLIVAAEHKFNVEFTDYELALDNYSTFQNFADLLSKKLDDLD
ncbi:MAG: acyl carrier protein [Eubacterium sp.]|nr:acyl carrier protein [Eubacterium sp.]MBR1674564.1 acyl carrier protein [Eubacterium sp.]